MPLDCAVQNDTIVNLKLGLPDRDKRNLRSDRIRQPGPVVVTICNWSKDLFVTKRHSADATRRDVHKTPDPGLGET